MIQTEGKPDRILFDFSKFKVLGSALIDLIKFSTNLTVIVAIVFGIIKAQQIERNEEVKITLQLISSTRTPEFLESLKRVKSKSILNNPVNDADFNDDLNLLVNTYDKIAVLYKNELADKCIIKTSIHHALNDLLPILKKIDYPPFYLTNIRWLYKEFNFINC